MEEKTIVIDKFLGLHQDSTSGLNIEIGELSELKNIRITENYKLSKREGYEEIIHFQDGNPIRGTWYGKVGSKYVLLVVQNGKIFEFEADEL